MEEKKKVKKRGGGGVVQILKVVLKFKRAKVTYHCIQMTFCQLSPSIVDSIIQHLL